MADPRRSTPITSHYGDRAPSDRHRAQPPSLPYGRQRPLSVRSTAGSAWPLYLFLKVGWIRTNRIWGYKLLMRSESNGMMVRFAHHSLAHGGSQVGRFKGQFGCAGHNAAGCSTRINGRVLLAPGFRTGAGANPPSNRARNDRSARHASTGIRRLHHGRQSTCGRLVRCQR